MTEGRPVTNRLPQIDRHPLYGACEDLYPVGVQPNEKLGGLQVHCVGRTSGLSEGVITRKMSFVKIHGRTTFSASWAVIGDFGG